MFMQWVYTMALKCSQYYDTSVSGLTMVVSNGVFGGDGGRVGAYRSVDAMDPVGVCTDYRRCFRLEGAE
jgi:hypothetical protein